MSIYHFVVWLNLNFGTIPSRSNPPPNRVLYHTHFMLICNVGLCEWSFRLYHPITYICYFVASYYQHYYQFFTTEYQIILCFYIYYFFICSNLNHLHNSQWIALPSQSCQLFYFLCNNSLQLLIMWLTILSASLHNLHSLFFCVSLIFALILITYFGR